MLTDYKQLCGIESQGNSGSLGIKIMVSSDRELTLEDSHNVREYLDKIEEVIRRETLKHDPKAKAEAAKQRDEIVGLFGAREIFVEEIPNGYCNKYCCEHLPWFIVTTKQGHITIGWRKRVIEIEWSRELGNANDLFPGEDVTKGAADDGKQYIHAWGLEKAKEYIDTLLNQ